MAQFLLRRLAWLLVVAFSIVTLTFVISRVIPADPARLAAGLHADPAQVAEVRRLMGLDQPLAQQYLAYLRGLLRGDLGRSVQSRQPVLDDIRMFLPATLELVVTAFSVYAVVGVSLGVVWAAWPDSWAARAIHLLTVSGVAVPVFWVGLVLQLLLGTRLGWLPVAGRLSPEVAPPPTVTGLYTVDALLAGQWGVWTDAVRHLVLPVAAAVFGVLSVATRLTRESVGAELLREYVRTARSKGVPEGSVLLRHVLPNAFNPVLTMLGLQFGWLLANSILVEVVFSWPGIGLYAFTSFQTFDYNPIMAITLIGTGTFFLVNTVVDLLYPLLDPRITASHL
jgi:ABC-type dipeptide/oligopeptide/nickel transport system permease component